MSFLTGRQQNKIENILDDVNWRQLANKLSLTNQIAHIDGICQMQRHPVSCRSNEILKRYINGQETAPCPRIVENIARALEALPIPETNKAQKLRSVCS